jgi:hypothetical protein
MSFEMSCARQLGSRLVASVERPARRAGCPAMLDLQSPPPNSLRSLRSLRSDNGGEMVDEAR